MGGALSVVGSGVLGQLGVALADLGTTVGRTVSCYARARTGTSSWSYTLVPFGTAATPLPVGVFFGPAPGAPKNTFAGAHAVVKATVEPVAAAAAGTLTASFEIDLTKAPAAMAGPRVELVICTERGVMAGVDPPKRLSVAIVGAEGATTDELPLLVRLSVTLPPPPPDGMSVGAEVRADVVTRVGRATAGLHVALLDGPVTIQRASICTSVAAAAIPANVKTLLAAAAPVLDQLKIGDGSAVDLAVVVPAGDVYTVDSAGTFSGARVRLDFVPATPGGTATATAKLFSPWAPGTRPALVATPAGAPAPAVPSDPVYRYAVAGLRANGSETPPGGFSNAVRLAVGQGVHLKLPPDPKGGAVIGWRVYRSRLVGRSWATPVALAPGPAAFDSTLPDIPPPKDPSGAIPPAPTWIELDWGKPSAPAPLPFPLRLHLETVDEVLDDIAPPAALTTSVDVEATLPATVSLALHPGRTQRDATAVSWKAPATTFLKTLSFHQPRTGMTFTVSTPAVPATVAADLVLEFAGVVGYAAWRASAAATITAEASIPTADGVLRVPFVELTLPPRFTLAAETTEPTTTTTEIFAGWRSDDDIGLGGWLRALLPGTDAALLDVGIEELASRAAARLVIPKKGATEERLEVVWADWALAPDAGTPPTARPVPAEDAPAALTGRARLLLRPVGHRTPALWPVRPSWGPGPVMAVALALGLRPAGQASVDAQLETLRRAVVKKASGPDLAVTSVIDAGAAVPVRVQVHSERQEKTATAKARAPQTLHARARRVGPAIDVDIFKGDFGDVQVKVGDRSSPIEGLRLFVEAGGKASDGTRPVGSHEPVAAAEIRDDGTVAAATPAREVSTVVAELGTFIGGARLSLEPAGPRPAKSKAPEPDPEDGRPLRVIAVLSGPHKPVPMTHARVDATARAGAAATALRLHLAETGTFASPSAVDAALVLPTEARLVLGKDAGTLGAGSGIDPGDASRVRLVDPDGSFEQGWVGRRVQWSTGTGAAPGVGAVESVPDPVTLVVLPDVGAAAPPLSPPPQNRPAGNWYRLLDPPRPAAGGSGLRLRCAKGASVRGRVGVEMSQGWGLAGVSATPQIRTDQRPDHLEPAPGTAWEDRDRLAALTARVAGLAAFDQSSWSGRGERSRLLGPLSDPPADENLRRTEAISSLVLGVRFAPGARPNPGLGVTMHQLGDYAVLDPARRRLVAGGRGRTERGRNALQLRLEVIPDALTLRIAPGTTEIVADGPSGPGSAHIESAQWLREASSFAEVGYASVVINSIPRRLVLANGWATPTMGGGVPTNQTKSFGALGSARSWRTDVMRIVAGGGDLSLGRFRSLGWDSFLEGQAPWTRDGKVRWAMSDLWFLKIQPAAEDEDAELLLYSPGEPQTDGDAGIQLQMLGGTVTARIFKVEFGDRTMKRGRRAAVAVGTEVGADDVKWLPKLMAEIQLDGIEGQFAVNMANYSKGLPDFKQRNEATAGSWWMCGYDKVLGLEAAQFGSSFGTLDLRDAPWDPYWA